MTPGLSVEDVHVHFGRVHALHGMSFTVEPGQLVGFLGPNGAGKTTTMRAILGVLDPNAGCVTWQGVPIDDARRCRIGYMPEERGLYPRMKVLEQVVYFGRLAGMSAGAARASALAWLERLGLAERTDANVADLSHGNQQRVQLAVALVHDPELLVLDEPFSGLDPLAVTTMSTIIAERSRAGTAVLFSSHQLDLVEDVCDDVVVIDHGRVVVRGPLAELREKAPYRRLEIALGGRPWTPPLDGLRPVPGPVDRACFLADRSVPLSAVLDAARATGGEVTALRYDPPALSDLFREAVAS